MRKDTGLFTALARTSSAEEVVRVILERGDSMAGLREELGAPAAAMVERIVRMRNSVVDTDGVLQPAHLAQGTRPDPMESGDVPSSPADGGSLPRVSRSARSVRAMPSSFLTSSRSSEGLGASNVMKLAGKLQRLIHLAEDERRLRDAQAQVRMSEEKPGEGALAHGPNATPNDKTPDIGSLQRDVLHAVMHEIEWHKKRRQEDPDGPDRW